jgi:hypothetical protein
MTSVMQVPILDQGTFDPRAIETEEPVLVLFGDG